MATSVSNSIGYLFSPFGDMEVHPNIYPINPVCDTSNVIFGVPLVVEVEEMHPIPDSACSTSMPVLNPPSHPPPENEQPSSEQRLLFDVDVCIAGTGLTECLLAASLSSRGYSVLQVDHRGHYGGNWMTLSFSELQAWLRYEDTWDNPIGKDSANRSLTKNLFLEPLLCEESEESEDAIAAHEARNANCFVLHARPDDRLLREGNGDTCFLRRCGAFLPFLGQIPCSSEDRIRLTPFSDNCDRTECLKKQSVECLEKPSVEKSKGRGNISYSSVNVDISDKADLSWEGLESYIAVQEELESLGNKFNIDILPRILCRVSPIVEMLIQSGAAKYLEFRSMDGCLFLANIGSRLMHVFKEEEKDVPEETRWSSLEYKASMVDISKENSVVEKDDTTNRYPICIERIPMSKGSIFSSPTLSLREKRLLMKFLSSFVSNRFSKRLPYEEAVTNPFQVQSNGEKPLSSFPSWMGYLKGAPNNMTNRLCYYLTYGICLCEHSPDSLLSNKAFYTLGDRANGDSTLNACTHKMDENELNGKPKYIPKVEDSSTQAYNNDFLRNSSLINEMNASNCNPINGYYKKDGALTDSRCFGSRRDMLEGLERLRLIIEASNLFEGNPWLFTQYGTSDIAQALTRSAALNGATFMLRQGIAKMYFHLDTANKNVPSEINESTSSNVKSVLYSCDHRLISNPGQCSNVQNNYGAPSLQLHSIELLDETLVHAKLLIASADSLPALDTQIQFSTASCIKKTFRQLLENSQASSECMSRSSHADLFDNSMEEKICHLIAICNKSLVTDDGFCLYFCCGPLLEDTPVHIVQTDHTVSTTPQKFKLLHLSHICTSNCYDSSSDLDDFSPPYNEIPKSARFYESLKMQFNQKSCKKLTFVLKCFLMESGGLHNCLYASSYILKPRQTLPQALSNVNKIRNILAFKNETRYKESTANFESCLSLKDHTIMSTPSLSGIVVVSDPNPYPLIALFDEPRVCSQLLSALLDEDISPQDCILASKSPDIETSGDSEDMAI